MKLLLHTCVWGGAIKVLEAFGRDFVWTGHRSKDPGYESSVLVNYGVINFTNALNVFVDKPPCNCRRDSGFYGQSAQHGVQFRQGVTGYDQFKGF